MFLCAHVTRGMDWSLALSCLWHFKQKFCPVALSSQHPGIWRDAEGMMSTKEPGCNHLISHTSLLLMWTRTGIFITDVVKSMKKHGLKTLKGLPTLGFHIFHTVCCLIPFNLPFFYDICHYGKIWWLYGTLFKYTLQETLFFTTTKKILKKRAYSKQSF